MTAERAFLRRLEGGCTVPAGAFARAGEDGVLLIDGVVADPTGSVLIRSSSAGGPADDPAALGDRLAEDLLDRGAAEILDRLWRPGS